MNKIKNKKKVFIIIIMIILLGGTFLIFYSFGNDEKVESISNDDVENIKLDEYYTVNFDTDDGSSIDSIVVKNGDKITEPDMPKKDGYNFMNWYLNDEIYDFNLPVTNDIILKAKWEKIKDNSTNNNEDKSDSKNNTTFQTNNNSNNTTNKINLNNNISVTEYFISSGDFNCFYYMFTSNLQEVFPEASINKISNKPANVEFWYDKEGRTATQVSREEINTFLSDGTLKINVNQENYFKNVLDKYKNSKYPGLANINYKEENHMFSLSYNYLAFNGLNVNSAGETFNKEINNILSDATLFKGPCGGFDFYQNVTLDEELCNKYNLTCDRW